MSELLSLSYDELTSTHHELMRKYEEFCSRNLAIDITRGKPDADQIDLANPMLSLPADKYFSADGTDCRNYGNLRGLTELKEIFSPIMPAPVENIIALGNSSLEIMHSMLVASFFTAPPGGSRPWSQGDKFLCPTPGYDRHFFITESLGIEMISVPMLDDGPDMDMVESIVYDDAQVKGMWLVPIFSNPTGVTISEKNMQRLATMTTAAPDFRIFWDNAYAVHTLTSVYPPVRDILTACEQAGNPDRVYLFMSTSKITLAGAGVAFMASSLVNIAWFMNFYQAATIGPDKLNQLRHVLYLQSTEHLLEIMSNHAALLRPKFSCALEILDDVLSPLKIAQWSEPEGGYFINIDVLTGSAHKVVELAARAGVKLTPAGATYPYRYDPHDSNIRLAPTFVSVEELEQGMQVLTCCIQIAAVEQLLEAYDTVSSV